MPKVVLLSQFPLPYDGIGSWTSLYKNYLSAANQVDVIICPEPSRRFSGTQYHVTQPSVFSHLKKKYLGRPYNEYMKPLQKMVADTDYCIIQIVDNFRMMWAVDEYLKKTGLRAKCHIQFFYHGFPPVYDSKKGSQFMDIVDELILLTNDSRVAHEQAYGNDISKMKVMHNGIDTEIFYKVTATEKEKLRKSLGLTSKKVFLWCSQDRPKKGLSVLMDAWKEVYNEEKAIELLVIGTTNHEPVAGVRYLGRIPNDQIANYYQASDVFLFPTQCLEGFGMSLIEALHCGCYCIASALGGVPEVLQYGKLGKLIDNPAHAESWIIAIKDYLKANPEPVTIPPGLYSAEAWGSDMNRIITNAKTKLRHQNHNHES